MPLLEQYAEKYTCAHLGRRDGILQVTLHSDGGPLLWGAVPHRELPELFYDIATDAANEVVILTGTGDAFSGPPGSQSGRLRAEPRQWHTIYSEGKRLLRNLLEIEVPMISAINGPALRHSEIPLLCDIVLASEDAVFQDSAHFTNGLTPGDGMHIVYPLLLGWNRGRYFLLTGQTLSAAQALAAGLVAEVVPRDELLPRAWALAEQVATQPPLVRRYSRILLTQPLRRMLEELLGYGLALEGLGAGDDQ